MPESPDGKRFLETEAVALLTCRSISALHMTLDDLGVRVKELRFRTAAGVETR